ncbi:ASKHA domain-containing protein [Sporomusa sp.]|uniref:ASKHA domain-containing protein n=1 Tax=Sporomusa sp. TaxID=2078658 RepID=UPI002CDF76E2|nr:ASKHA domain-containing protein [Sporomusa sp.]HWR09735.1 ASKHA domain-containing protein [Sporomusa sp.]
MPILRFWQETGQADAVPVSYEFLDNITVLAAARAAGVLVESPCNGAGTCGKCKVRIPALSRSALHSLDGCRHTLTTEEVSQGIFLGCMTEIQAQSVSSADSFIDIFIIERQDTTNVQILSQGRQLDIALDPLIRKQYIPGATMTEVLSGPLLLGTEPGDSTGVSHGLVVDIGTTTLVAALFDLTTGSELASVSALNPQSLHAQDVLSRIKLGATAEGLSALHTDIISAINSLIGQLTHDTAISPNTIYEVVFSGNTCMLHLAMAADPASLGKYPYTPLLWGDSYHAASEVGLAAAPFAQLYLPPVMSAYVGADITAGILAADLSNLKGTTLFVDIGTNGEMALAVNGRLSVTSTAAGPAFEGMNIACGMRAAPGAIEKFTVEPGGTVMLKTIADSPATGICGSGLLDIVGELVRTKIINKTGKFAGLETNAAHPLQQRLQKENGKTAFAIHQSVYLSQKDIRQVQLAKGAIRAGIECLLNANSLVPADVDRVFIAGSFGFHLNADSLINIGMLPNQFQDKISFLGNTAKTGGQALLLNQGTRQAVAALIKKVAVVELATYSDFDKTFVSCLNF